MPDLGVLCNLILRPDLNTAQRFRVIKMMFGGQTDDFDLHKIGLNSEFLADYLNQVSDVLRVEEGSLYPALHRLESQGFVESEWRTSEHNRRARFYTLTPRGRKQVTVEISNWRQLVEAVNRVIDPLTP